MSEGLTFDLLHRMLGDHHTPANGIIPEGDRGCQFRGLDNDGRLAIFKGMVFDERLSINFMPFSWGEVRDGWHCRSADERLTSLTCMWSIEDRSWIVVEEEGGWMMFE